MRITHIDAYHLEYPITGGQYSFSRDRAVRFLDSTVVRVGTDSGIVGFGECCPLGPSYMEAYGEGVRAALTELAPALMGQNPCQIHEINDRMDRALRGHNYAKAPLDMACWDIFGKAVNLPVSALLGGTRNPEYPLYRAISMGTETAMADEVLEYKSEGYHRFQLKVGGDPAEDIRRIRAVAEVIDSSDILVADANTGWTTHEALRTARATEDLDIYIEQPCATWGEVAAIRKQIRQPLILCELITDVHAILEVAHSRVADVVNLKVSRLGGLTRTAQARDLCERLGLPMTIEDGMGGDIVTAAVSQLAASTRPGYLFSTTHMNLYGSIPIAKGVPQAVNGRTRVSVLPGLGIDVDEQLLGRPMLSYRE